MKTELMGDLGGIEQLGNIAAEGGVEVEEAKRRLFLKLKGEIDGNEGGGDGFFPEGFMWPLSDSVKANNLEKKEKKEKAHQENLDKLLKEEGFYRMLKPATFSSVFIFSFSCSFVSF